MRFFIFTAGIENKANDKYKNCFSYTTPIKTAKTNPDSCIDEG